MIRRLRWRLARALAPEAILTDLTEGKDGAFVFQRVEGTTIAFPLAAYKVRSWLRLPSDLAEAYENGKAFGDFSRWNRRYFVGRVGR